MSSDDEVEVLVSWEALLKRSPVYEHAYDIFCGKAHKSPPIDKKHTMLMNIVSRPLEEYFLRGTRHAEDFQLLKMQCCAGWTSASNCSQVWTVPYMAKMLALLIVLRDQVDSKKKVRASSCVGEASPMNNLK
jgi:hypothetical protein